MSRSMLSSTHVMSSGKVKVPRWNGKWFELGPMGKNGVQGKDERRKKCDMFDKLNEYMLH